MNGAQTAFSSSPAEIEIERLVYGGAGLGRLDGLVVLVEGALPGERVEAEIVERRRRYARARLHRVLRASPFRVEPPCPVFGRCGGCSLLHADYTLQLAAKTQFARDAFRRRPDQAARVRDIVPAPQPMRFRNRMSYSIAPTPEGPVVGLHARGDPSLIVPAHTCVLCPEWHGEFLRQTAAVLTRAGAEPTLARRLDLREGRRTGQRMVVLAPPPPAAVLDAWRRACGPLVDTIVIARKLAADGTPISSHPIQGRGRIEERLGRWTFEIEPRVFFQTFTEQAETMFRAAAELAAELKPTRVVELYAGIGAWTAFLSEVAETVVATEISEPAVAAARRNLRRNGIHNVRFLQADAARFLPPTGEPPPDIVAFDPPRAGLDSAARDAILRCRAPALLYLSCDPMTLARDADFFQAHGYRLDSVQPFDLFPQTYRVECVARFRR
jgi:23S rRNA (uracil1939-C5)-methyltransferase